MTSASGATAAPRSFVRSDVVIIVGGSLLVLLAGAAHYGHWDDVPAFVVSAAAVTLLASLVGRSVEQLGDRFGPGATGVLQSALGNLPELFISIFALKAGLVEVVKAALVGSILANLLLGLGLAFLDLGLSAKRDQRPRDLSPRRRGRATRRSARSITWRARSTRSPTPFPKRGSATRRAARIARCRCRISRRT